MMHRRRFLSGVGAAAAVLGFDSATRLWVSTAEAQSSSFCNLPALDGEVVTSPSTLSAFSTDAGNIVHRTPMAVLLPGSVNDIVAMVRYCRRHHIKVAARGQAHSTHGQSLAALMIDMSSLSSIHSVDEFGADVDAGATWMDVVGATIPLGLTPPNLTGFVGLSLGGTLSMGGISAGPDRGGQVDDVLELEVVTGEGNLVRCSEDRNRDLFEGVLGGLGQMGIITRAVVQLTPAMPRALTFQLPYFDNTTFFADFKTLLSRNEFDDCYNLWVPGGPTGWIYVLTAVKFYDPAAPPDEAHLLRGLSYFQPGASTIDTTYHEYVLRVDTVIDMFKALGMWDGVMHPWFDVFLPGRHVEQYVGEVMPTLGPEDVGPAGFILLFPKRRSRMRRPFFRVPDDEWVFLFDILGSAPAPGFDQAFADRMLARNRRLFDKARQIGGTRYPIGSLEFSRRDWVHHYGETLPRFSALQRRYDPNGILTPGLNL